MCVSSVYWRRAPSFARSLDASEYNIKHPLEGRDELNIRSSSSRARSRARSSRRRSLLRRLGRRLLLPATEFRHRNLGARRDDAQRARPRAHQLVLAHCIPASVHIKQRKRVHAEEHVRHRALCLLIRLDRDVRHRRERQVFHDFARHVIENRIDAIFDDARQRHQGDEERLQAKRLVNERHDWYKYTSQRERIDRLTRSRRRRRSRVHRARQRVSFRFDVESFTTVTLKTLKRGTSHDSKLCMRGTIYYLYPIARWYYTVVEKLGFIVIIPACDLNRFFNNRMCIQYNSCTRSPHSHSLVGLAMTRRTTTTTTTYSDAPTTEKFDSTSHLEITFGGRTDARTTHVSGG